MVDGCVSYDAPVLCIHAHHIVHPSPSWYMHHHSQAEYWRLAGAPDDMLVEYGSDLEGSAFAEAGVEDPLARSAWNLQVIG